MLQGLQIQHNIRLRQAKIKISDKYKKQQQKLRSDRKSNVREKNSYMTGGYLANVVPGILTTNTTVLDDVTMIYDIDVKEWITLFKK